MSRLNLVTEWLDAPPAEEAFGPERSTWARLCIYLDGEPITLNHPADVQGGDRAYVVGGMSGLADWIVDAWLPIHHEIHTPFPKVSSARPIGGAARLPSTRDALRGWPDFLAETEVSGGEMGEWQQRHTVGSARSDVAIPSMVLVPEGAWMGVGLDHVPAALSPTVRFRAPAGHGAWPLPPFWLPAKDVTAALGAFVDATIQRAAQERSTEAWARWMQERWDVSRRRAAAPEEARRWMFGEIVAQQWEKLSALPSAELTALTGVLTDSSIVADAATLATLETELSTTVEEGKRFTREFAAVDWGLAPYREGYRLAQEVRERLKLGFEPLGQQDLKGVLAGFGVSTKKVKARGLFRSAVWTRGGGATLALPSDDSRFGGPIPSRFTLAAGLGRFLTAFEEGEAGGAAVGEQSRWRPTQLATAFAAELLLPVQAIEKGFRSVKDLSKRYGISLSAAAWHIENRCPAEG